MTRRPKCPRPDKRGHNTQDGAQIQARIIAQQALSDGLRARPLYGYVCVCRRWHVTSRPSWKGEENIPLWSVPEDLQEWALTGSLPVVLTPSRPPTEPALVERYGVMLNRHQLAAVERAAREGMSASADIERIEEADHAR